MNYRVAKNRRKHRTHRPEQPKPSKPVVKEPTILCKPSGRLMTAEEYAEIYHRELAVRDAFWRKCNAASPYHPRLV